MSETANTTGEKVVEVVFDLGCEEMLSLRLVADAFGYDASVLAIKKTIEDKLRKIGAWHLRREFCDFTVDEFGNPDNPNYSGSLTLRTSP